MRYIVGPLLVLLSLAVNGESKLEWPSLSEIKHVSGRTATEEDVNDGAAAFLIQVDGENIGAPLDVIVPQYAFHIDEETSIESPVVIIQAEEGNGSQVIGAFNIRTKEYQVGLIHEYNFLGTEKPDE